MVHHLVTKEDPAPEAPFLKLYSASTPNGRKITILLELLGLNYNVQKVDIVNKNEQKSEWYLKMNPNGRIPTLESLDKEGKSTYINESAAILIYLADKYDTERKYSYATGTPLYYEELEWVFFQMAGLGPMAGQYGHFARHAPEKIEYAIKRYYDETNRLFGVLEERLKRNGTGYLVGDHISLADISSFPWVYIAKSFLTKEFDELPQITLWLEKVGSISEVQAGNAIPPIIV